VEGFVPNSQLGIENLKDPADHFRVGQPLELRVIESDAVNRRIVLTVIAIPEFEGGATPEGTELVTETEVRPTEEQIEDQAAAPESSIEAEVPAAELAPEEEKPAEEEQAEAETAEEASAEAESAEEEPAEEA